MGNADTKLNFRKAVVQLTSKTQDLLFCPDFTVALSKKLGPDKAEELQSVDSCEYIWEAGVGFAHSPPRCPLLDSNRTELLKLILTCFSETMYSPPIDLSVAPNRWIQYLTGAENRHALPMFTSLLNTVCAYDPVGLGVPYNHLLFTDSLEPLVDVALQILIVTLDHDTNSRVHMEEGAIGDNLFINYLSRIHRDEDFQFVLKGITRLLNNPLMQTYLPNSTKKVHFHQELLVLFWKMCDYNKKFLYYVLKSSDVLEVLVPILYHLNDSRADQSRVGLMHIGVFILLLLSGERNFGVRLNKPYTATVPMDIPVFTGTHADLLVTVFHKIITTGHQRLQPLFDCLLTILVNVSPYLKTLSMVASTKLLHLLEAFSTPWFLFSAPTNHHLVFFLLEIFNNIIQYQFDGNSNLVYTIIRKRQVFHALANLPTDCNTITKSLNKRQRRYVANSTSSENISEAAMEGSRPAQPAEPGTLKATLLETPGIENMTEKESAHPLSPSVDVDSSEEISRRDSKTLSEESSSFCKTNFIVSKGGIRIGEHSSLDVNQWIPSVEWVCQWKNKLPLQTIMRLLQVLVPQVEKICIDKGLTDESEILKFLQHGTLVGLLPVPHPILIRRYQANAGTTAWFRTYMWGVIYLRNVEPPIWYDTDVKLFEIQRV
ncbi:protein HID1 isoform X2 [Belonocnema kinseyi]|uniref:protein HID1 isoform X2 n=1 Tax=Belonocnema kinseyi TaxID=2817044 RepID=UPI00143D5316|nr:protein HID1 isoform X2 [Belonocnema kinseyi]